MISIKNCIHGFATAALAALVLVAAVSFAQEPAEEPEPDPKLDVTETIINAPGIDRPLHIIEFDSPSVGRLMKYMVMLPAGYDDPANAEKNYPVLYLLHGFSQNYTVWPRMGAPHYTADMDVIVVMPDAGNTWYVNWSESDDGELNNWEDFIVVDLIQSVDSIFRTVTHRGGRAINGVSMGGFGAVSLGLRHPDLFCSIGSQSGTLSYARNARQRLEAGEPPVRNAPPPAVEDERDSNVPDLIAIPGFTRQHERYPNGVAFRTAEECAAYDPFELITQVPLRVLPHIYIDCGLEDGLIADAQEFAKLLMEKGIPFAYGQTPGQHGVNYWTREAAQSIAVQYNIVERNVNR